MRLSATIAFGIGLFFATPSFADCAANGGTTIEGGRLCQAGTVLVCSQHDWLNTTLTCQPPPGVASQALVTPLHAPESNATPVLIHVLTAHYRSGDLGSDFVFTLRSRCDGKARCDISGDASLLQPDPAPRQRGAFSVIYACTTGFETKDTKQAVFGKGQAQSLSCSE